MSVHSLQNFQRRPNMLEEDFCYNMIAYLRTKSIHICGLTYSEIKNLYDEEKKKEEINNGQKSIT